MSKKTKIFAVIWLLIFPFTVFAQGSVDEQFSVNEEQVTQVSEESIEKTPLTIFIRKDCAHCHDAMLFLSDLKERRDDFEVIEIDIDQDNNIDLFNQVIALDNLSRATPITLLGNTVIVGFDKPETTGVRFESLLDASRGKNTLRLDEYLEQGGSGGMVETVDGGTCGVEKCEVEDSSFLVSIPFYGPYDVKQLSLPVMSLVLGFIDGFNPCAMWVLVTFLIVLLQVGDKRKMLQIAGLFILAEAVMYYLILNVWFTAWDFIGLDRIVTPVIGLLAVGGGIFFLYEWKTSDGTCQVTNLEQRKKIQGRIRAIASKPMTWVTAAGVIALAFSVNIIEFACSIGIPQAFTKIIELNALSWLHSQFLMLLYILMYMVDDVIVFGLAYWGASSLAMTTKYSKLCNLIGGILMLILGALLMFAPDLLRL